MDVSNDNSKNNLVQDKEGQLVGQIDETNPRVKEVIDKLREVYDPEVAINVYDLGLIYGIDVSDGKVKITMTLTFRGCPLGEIITYMVKHQVEKLDWVKEVEVQLTFDPPWSRERIKWENIRNSSSKM